jgi:hypothetical protein
MAVPESVRKAVSLVIIATLFCASAWLPQWPASVETLPSRPLPVTTLAPPPLPSRVRPGSEPITTPFRPRTERVQSRLRTDSEQEYGATQGLGTSEVAELRTRSLPVTATTAPAAITAGTVDFAAGDPVKPLGRALATAGRETRGAFQTAGRAIRGAFARVQY